MELYNPEIDPLKIEDVLSRFIQACFLNLSATHDESFIEELEYWCGSIFTSARNGYLPHNKYYTMPEGNRVLVLSNVAGNLGRIYIEAGFGTLHFTFRQLKDEANKLAFTQIDFIVFGYMNDNYSRMYKLNVAWKPEPFTDKEVNQFIQQFREYGVTTGHYTLTEVTPGRIVGQIELKDGGKRVTTLHMNDLTDFGLGYWLLPV